MDNESSQIIIDFNNHAKKIFFSLFDKFIDSTKQLDRRKDDNVFQQQQGKFLNSLKNQLEDIAREFLHNNRALENISQLTRQLTEGINAYLYEFRQKTRSL